MIPLSAIVYIVSGLSLLFAALTLLLVSRYYAVAELKMLGVTKALLAIAFLTAFVFQELLARDMLFRGVGAEAAFASLLLGSGPLRGPEAGVAWFGVLSQGFMATTILLAATAVHGACTVSTMFNLGRRAMALLVGSMAILAAVSIGFSAAAVNLLNPYAPVPPMKVLGQGLLMRDAANASKVAMIALLLALLTLSYARTYSETREYMFLGYAVSMALILVGWLLTGLTTLTAWEKMAVMAGAAGQVTLVTTYTAALVFLAAGSAGALVATIAGYAAPRQA